MPFRPAESTGTVCSGGSKPGTRKLAMVLMDLFDRSIDSGIYNCRPSSGGGGLSTHGEGRAFDMGYRMISGAVDPQGYEVLWKLSLNAWELGIQRIIWDRKSYSAAHPNGIVYTGQSPHTDHLHIEQTRAFALSLTAEQAYQYLEGETMTPEEKAALTELVAVRAQLAALTPPSSLSALVASAKLVRIMRLIDDQFDSSEF